MIQDSNTFTSELQKLGENARGIQSGTALYKYIQWLNTQLEHKNESFVRQYLPIIQEEKKHIKGKNPFITVITRTQGKRIEMLMETLLSLSGQTDDDFEIILIAHKANDENKLRLQKIINEQPASLKSKLRYLDVDYGTRTVPLNIGFAYAHGEYVVVLDDDDVVFDNWVESFHSAANKKPGAILHAYVLTQKWMTIKLPYGGEALRAVDAYGTECCRDFELIRQLDINMCPLNGLAFPTYYFHQLGMIFDETLTTTEDWDYFMRLSFISGVTDIKSPTCIYRLWNNSENSQTIHNQFEWENNYKKIQKKYFDMPILIPQGKTKVYRIYIDVDADKKQERINTKNKIRNHVPNIIWRIIRKVYRILGGKKWIG